MSIQGFKLNMADGSSQFGFVAIKDNMDIEELKAKYRKTDNVISFQCPIDPETILINHFEGECLLTIAPDKL